MLSVIRNFFGRRPEDENKLDFNIVDDDDDDDGLVDWNNYSIDDYFIIESVRKPLNFNRITDNIFLGACPATEDDVGRLKAAGVTAVLNLQTDFDLSKKEIDWEQLVKYYESAGIQWKRNPTIDYNNNDLKNKVPLSLLWLSSFIKQGHIVYVHCNSGISRSPTVVAAYLHLQGMSVQSAINYVLARRQSWPDEGAVVIGCRIYNEG
jgi:atypical dual specificity phosphatase